jgi:hypothetical protein
MLMFISTVAREGPGTKSLNDNAAKPGTGITQSPRLWQVADATNRLGVDLI